ncbi:hypothetical protein SORBI_3006G146600 [Sorghum bicolor]|uniref:Uncharacterized protein n=1 Tax=Sorghum bicolor TaxID=4558 RepID=A0A1B6PM18_SORBI|nr:hypothetical protein SORBI_3006G146600 [Sorghum bicolor]
MGAVSCGEQFVHCYAMQDGNSVLWRTICALLDAMQGRECCVHGHHHGSRSRGNSLRATVETSWRQFSVKLLFSLFASQLEIRPYTHLVCLTLILFCFHKFISLLYIIYQKPSQDAFLVGAMQIHVRACIYIHSCTIILFVILRVLSDSQKYAFSH